MTLKNSKFILTLVVLLGAIAAYYALRQMPKNTLTTSPESKMMVEIAPKELLEQIKGRRAKVTLLNVWASWCGPCIEELPLLVRLRNEFKDREFELVLYSADKPEDREEAINFLEAQNVDFLNFAKGKASIGEMEALYPGWEGVLPVSVLFDEEGAIIQKWMGTISYEEFKTLVETALK